jgi:uncharacterized protein YaiI (UPF0178 family)
VLLSLGVEVELSAVDVWLLSTTTEGSVVVSDYVELAV